MNDEQFLTEKQVAASLGMHPDTIRRWRKRGAIGHVLTPGGRIRYRSEDVRRLIKAMNVEPSLGNVL